MIRISGGEFKGFKLKLPSSSITRPTSEKVRKAIFDVLGPSVSGSRFLDLFAGSGAVGIEALSRGAEFSLFIEKNRDCCKIISENLKKCGLENRSEIVCYDSVKYVGRDSVNFGIIYIDPPYFEEIYRQVLLNLDKNLKRNSTIIVEHFKKTVIDSNFANLKLFKQKTYGDTVVDFLEISRAV